MEVMNIPAKDVAKMDATMKSTLSIVKGVFMMKKYGTKMVGIVFFVTLVVMVTMPSLALNAQRLNDRIPQNPRIRIDGKLIQIPYDDQQPEIVDGRVMIPLRAVTESLGFTIEWNAQTQTVMLEGAEYNTVVQVGSYEMSVNGNIVTLDVPAQIINARTMLPVRAVSEATGFDVQWDSLNRTVHILSPITIDHWPESLPQHMPGDITLRPEQFFTGIVDHLSAPMRFRILFYTIPLEFFDMVNDDEVVAWTNNIGRLNEDEMLLMHFVQDFNIPRENFDSVVNEMRTRAIEHGRRDLADEWYELPNADIIYTFDNDIIRYFYRRE